MPFNSHQRWNTSELGHPEEPGVYVVIAVDVATHKRTALYIGSSKNIHKRIMAPSHPYRILFDRADMYVTCIIVKWKTTSDYINLEKALIEKLSPTFNIQHNGKKIYRYGVMG